MASNYTSSGSSSTIKPVVKKVVKKPVVKKVVKQLVKPKNIRTTSIQEGTNNGNEATITTSMPLWKEKWPLAIVLYKYIRSDINKKQIAYIDISIGEIKAWLAYYEQDRDPTITPEKIKANMKSFISSAINEMNDREIFVPGSLDTIKTELNWLIDGLNK